MSPELITDDNVANTTLSRWVCAPRWWQHLLIGLIFILLWWPAEWLAAHFKAAYSVSGWYLPAGLGVALIWGFGPRYIWAIVSAGTLGGLTIWHMPPRYSFSAITLHVLFYSSMALLLRRKLPPGRLPTNPVPILLALSAMLIAPLGMSFCAVGLMIDAGLTLPESKTSVVLGWWVGDAIGILVTAPLIVMVLLPMTIGWAPKNTGTLTDKHDVSFASLSGKRPFTIPLLASIATVVPVVLLYATPLAHTPKIFLLGFIAVPLLATWYGLTGALLGLGTYSITGLVAIAWQDMDYAQVVDLQLMIVALGCSAFFMGSVVSMRQSVITARLADEQWTTLALKGSRMGRWLWDVDHNQMYTDHVLSSHLGYPEDQVERDIAWWINLTHEQDMVSVHGGINELIKGDIDTWIGERRLRAADGSWRWIASHGALVKANHFGKGKLIAGVHQDITEQKRLQQVEADTIAQLHREEIDAHLKRTEKLDAIGIFASGIAHDFHNTLLAISASAQSARKHLESNRAAARPLNVVEEACEQAREITASLLAFARGQGAAKEPLNLAQTLRDTARLLDALLPSTIAVEVHAPDEAETWVMGNRSELQQVLMNLAMNARDAVTGHGVLTFSLDPPRENSVKLHVADNGCGMTPAVIDRAFEPFFTTKARLKGTGLGLALVHGIITDHLGDVAISSTPGVGTRVSISLPLIEADTLPRSHPPSLPPTEQGSP